MERVWCMCSSKKVALGYDEGSIITKVHCVVIALLTRALWGGPVVSMDSSGKVMWAHHSEVQQANLKARAEAEVRDGERLSMGTAMALGNKSFGSAQEIVWAHDSCIFGGFLLGGRSNSGLAFYDRETSDRIPTLRFNPSITVILLCVSSGLSLGSWVCIVTDESFFVLRFLLERMTKDEIEVGIGMSMGRDRFIYTSSVNRLNYYVGGEIITIAHMDSTKFTLWLGVSCIYTPVNLKHDKICLTKCLKTGLSLVQDFVPAGLYSPGLQALHHLNVISYSLLLSVLEYQTAETKKDVIMAYIISREQRTQGSRLLGEIEHKFELALQLGEIKIAYQLALEAESEQKWKQLVELATAQCQFSLAQECLHQAQDYGGLLLLATASGAARDGKTNVAFLTYILQGILDKCLDLLIKTNPLPEAAFLARTYLPSHVSRLVKLWKQSLLKVNQKAADALADPTQYSSLFTGLQQALMAEQYLMSSPLLIVHSGKSFLITSCRFTSQPNENYNVLEESAGLVCKEEVNEPPIESQEHPVTIAEEHVGPKQAVSSEVSALETLMDIVTKSEKALASAEDYHHSEEPEMMSLFRYNAIIDFTAEECVSETVPSPPTVEELISFQITLYSQFSVRGICLSQELSTFLLPDSLEDKMPVLEQVPTQISEQEIQQKASPIKPEDNLEVSLEPEVLSPAAAPTDVNIAEEEEAAA
ncbi:hypothetical protein Q8A73_006924 [Channa argus]|nr:hypothetical protein Q8A73_006924 [Channa argus]